MQVGGVCILEFQSTVLSNDVGRKANNRGISAGIYTHYTKLGSSFGRQDFAVPGKFIR